MIGAYIDVKGRSAARVRISFGAERHLLSAEQFHTEATMRRMPGLGIVTARRSAAIYRLPREFIDNDDVVVTVGLTSSYEAHQFDRLLNLKPGEAIVLTASEPVS